MKLFTFVLYHMAASLKYYQTTYKECDLVIGYWSEWAEWSDCKCKVYSFINKEDFKLQSNKVKLRSHAVRRSVCQGAKATMLLWCRFRHKRMRYVVRSTSHVHWWSVLRRVIRWSLGRVGAMWGHPSESKQTIVIVMRLFIFSAITNNLHHEELCWFVPGEKLSSRALRYTIIRVISYFRPRNNC